MTTRCTGKGSGGVVWLVAEIDEPQQGGSVVCEWGKHPPGWCNHVVTTP